MPAPAPVTKELSLLTGVRFLAAFYVFVYHVDIHNQLAFLPEQLQQLIHQGALGVNLFFMLSGFLLAYSHLRDFEAGKLPTWPYYRWFLFKRFSRIYPVYVAGLLLTLGVDQYLGSTPALPIILLNGLMLGAYIWPFSLQWYGSMAWSISAETFFYFVFPFVLPVLLRLKQQYQLWLLLAVCIGLGTFPGLLFNLKHTPVSFELQYTFAPLRLAEFVAGILTAILVFRFGLRVPAWLSLLALGLLSCWLLVVGPRSYGFMLHNIVIIPTFALLLATCAQPGISNLLRWLGSPVAVYLGRISYCFYITQYAVVNLLEPLAKSGSAHLSAPLFLVIALLLNLVCAVLFYELLEKRSHRQLLAFGKKHWAPVSKPRLVAN